MGMYGIMRIEKRARSAVYGIQIEANRKKQDHDKGRDFDMSDIDWDITEENIQMIHTDNWNQAITQKLKQSCVKERKNSIVMLDAIYTASPAWFDGKSKQDIIEYFNDCIQFHP